MAWPNVPPVDGTKLITPGGKPASRKILNAMYDDKTAEWLGFHSTTLPYKHSLQSSAFTLLTMFSINQSWHISSQQQLTSSLRGNTRDSFLGPLAFLVLIDDLWPVHWLPTLKRRWRYNLNLNWSNLNNLIPTFQSIWQTYLLGQLTMVWK